jgi:hypothetical protein
MVQDRGRERCLLGGFAHDEVRDRVPERMGGGPRSERLLAEVADVSGEGTTAEGLAPHLDEQPAFRRRRDHSPVQRDIFPDRLHGQIRQATLVGLALLRLVRSKTDRPEILGELKADFYPSEALRADRGFGKQERADRGARASVRLDARALAPSFGLRPARRLHQPERRLAELDDLGPVPRCATDAAPQSCRSDPPPFQASSTTGPAG